MNYHEAMRDFTKSADLDKSREVFKSENFTIILWANQSPRNNEKVENFSRCHQNKRNIESYITLLQRVNCQILLHDAMKNFRKLQMDSNQKKIHC
jgi:hypothetical protein